MVAAVVAVAVVAAAALTAVAAAAVAAEAAAAVSTTAVSAGAEAVAAAVCRPDSAQRAGTVTRFQVRIHPNSIQSMQYHAFLSL